MTRRRRWLVEKTVPRNIVPQVNRQGDYVLNRTKFHGALKAVFEGWIGQLRADDAVLGGNMRRLRKMLEESDQQLRPAYAVRPAEALQRRSRRRAREGNSLYPGVLRSATEEAHMEVVYRRCAGLDVHKNSISACVLISGPGEESPEVAKRTFGTFTSDLVKLKNWLQACEVTHVVMESTGVYWILVWNLLEQAFHLLLVNPQHFRAVPGRKTDQKDSEWLAQLLQYGLVRGSFVPRRTSVNYAS